MYEIDGANALPAKDLRRRCLTGLRFLAYYATIGIVDVKHYAVSTCESGLEHSSWSLEIKALK
jgi:hypothetical protein